MKIALWKDPLAEVEEHKLSEVLPIETGDPTLYVRRIGHPAFLRELLAAARQDEGLRQMFFKGKAATEITPDDAAEIDTEQLLSLLENLREPAVALVQEIRGAPVISEDGGEVETIDTRSLKRDEAHEVTLDLLSNYTVLAAVVSWAQEKEAAFHRYVGGLAKNSSTSSRTSAGKIPRKSGSSSGPAAN